MKLLLYLPVVFLIGGCAQSNIPQDLKQEEITLPVSSEVEDPVVGPVTSSTQSLPPVLYLCLSGAPKGWPVEQIINGWNANGKNLFIVGPPTGEIKCRERINFILVSRVNYEGETEFKPDSIEVRLNKDSQYKTHTLCHELGHVLGIPHTSPGQDPQSCMNINATVITPSKSDLEKVGAQYWIKEESARHAVGQ